MFVCTCRNRYIKRSIFISLFPIKCSVYVSSKTNNRNLVSPPPLFFNLFFGLYCILAFRDADIPKLDISSLWQLILRVFISYTELKPL